MVTRRTAPPIRAFGRSLPMQLMRAREAVMQRFRPHLRAHDLTEQQWRIIRVLVEAEALEMLDIAARCCIHPASLSRIIPRLEQRRLLTRRADEADQRRVLVSITAEGRALFAAMAAESEAIYAAIMGEIGPERLQALYSLLDEVIGLLGEAPPGRGTEG
jgi:homoprotocatechuate degradation regulator HpaR